MSIMVDKNTKVLVQGLTGEAGTVHGNGMLEYGTQVVAGVTPGKGGTFWESKKGVKVPIFNTCEDAVEKTGANASRAPSRRTASWKRRRRGSRWSSASRKASRSWTRCACARS
jgi:hypothetical protein